MKTVSVSTDTGIRSPHDCEPAAGRTTAAKSGFIALARGGDGSVEKPTFRRVLFVRTASPAACRLTHLPSSRTCRATLDFRGNWKFDS
jgi:hypothetical protein